MLRGWGGMVELKGLEKLSTFIPDPSKPHTTFVRSPGMTHSQSSLVAARRRGVSDRGYQ